MLIVDVDQTDRQMLHQKMPCCHVQCQSSALNMMYTRYMYVGILPCRYVESYKWLTFGGLPGRTKSLARKKHHAAPAAAVV